MRCGRILVEGEAEEVSAFPSPRNSRLPRRQHSSNKKDGKVKGSNPYSARGLEKFASLHEELAAKREYVAKKTGASEDLVRFCYSNKGWIPVVVKGVRSGSGGEPRVSILRPVRRKKDDIRGGEENGGNLNGCLEIENNNNSKDGDNVKIEAVVPWSGYVVTTAFGVLSLSALVLRKSVLPAAAMAVVMVVGVLQKQWQGGVMCMKKFVMSGLSYFSGLIVQLKNKMVKKEAEKISENVINEIKNRHEKSLSVSNSSLRVKNEIHQSSKSKAYGRIVSMDSQPRKSVRSDDLKSDSPLRGGQNEIRQLKNKMVKKEAEKIPENVFSEIKNRHEKSLSVSNSPSRVQNEIHQSSKSKAYGRIVSMDSQPTKSVRSDDLKSDSPLRGGQNEIRQSSPKKGVIKNKQYVRIVSMDGQPRKPIRSDYHKSDSFNRSFKTRRMKKGGVAPSATVGATVMIIVLLCLIFYGRLCAILFTSAWWYLLPKFRIEANVSENGDSSKMDLKQRELRKKKVIMDGLLDRSHNNNNMGRS